MDDGKYKIGSVFNLDDHDEPGSHWVSLYIELKPCCREKPSVYYFDSVAEEPTKEINKLVENIFEQYKSINNEDIEFLYNDIQHQKKNTECGIYSIHFITSMLEGHDFNKYIKDIKNDEYMEKYRDFYYIR
jgi:Ulp1 family protease